MPNPSDLTAHLAPDTSGDSARPSERASLTRDDLVEPFVRAIKPDRRDHVVGTEIETFGLASGPRGVLMPVRYDLHVRPVLRALAARHGWTKVGDDGPDTAPLVELRRNGAAITLEPGGQLELSGRPLHNAHESAAELAQHDRELDEVSSPLGIGWMAAGFHPFASRSDVDWMPKGRYAVMRDYLPARGDQALDMMVRTCTVQANLDYTSETDCGRRYVAAVLLAPLLGALFANSPYRDGQATERASTRLAVWRHVDPDRCGVPPFVTTDPRTFSFEAYVDWALAVPMFFVKRGEAYHPHHAPFRDFLRDGFVDPLGTRHLATRADWELHLSTLFPDVRLKPYIELRTADAVPSPLSAALPALCRGILYDEDALSACLELLGSQSREDRESLLEEASTGGLAHPRIHPWCRRIVAEARAALDRFDVRDERGRSEAVHLDPLSELVDAQQSRADRVRAQLGAHPGLDLPARVRYLKSFYASGARGEDLE